MELIYINELGPDFKGQKQYEFIFSEDDEIDDENWFNIPASSIQSSLSPNINYINMIGLLKDTDIDLELVQNSDYFGMIDAVDGIIALGWEKFNEENNNNRLYFKFGDDIKNVTEKLLNKKHKLIINKIK
jgi:hypothetical protein